VATSTLTSPAPSETLPPRWVAGYALAALIWGSSFLFIKVGVRELHPTHLTLARCLAGATVLLTIVLVTRDRLPRDRRLWAHLALLGLIGNALPFTLFAYGEQRVSSIVAGIWNATTPLMVILIVSLTSRARRPNAGRVLGLLLGFVGVLMVLGVWRGVGGGSLTGQLMCAAAAASYGVAIPYTQRVIAGRSESGVSLAAAQVLLAAGWLAVFAPILGGAPPSRLSLDVVGSVLALGTLGTGVALWLYYRILQLAGATTASTITYFLPVVAAFLGVTLLGERLHWFEPVGALVILTGVALSQGLLQRLVSARRPTP
jgi:drug/metabolite transporter (DMT)-like permease